MGSTAQEHTLLHSIRFSLQNEIVAAGGVISPGIDKAWFLYSCNQEEHLEKDHKEQTPVSQDPLSPGLEDRIKAV
jgi:hypothetical protein